VTITAPTELSQQVLDVVRDELNVKQVICKKGSEIGITLDMTVTPELAEEGKARGLVREIQMLRKEKGCTIDQPIAVSLPIEYKKLPDNLVSYIKKETLATGITWEETLNISIG